MTDTLQERLREGTVFDPDKYDGTAGSDIDQDATDALMHDAADALDAKDAEIARLRVRLDRKVVRREMMGFPCTICHGDHDEDYICGE